MSYVRKYKRPTKRCKKGKSQGGPSVNFNIQGIGQSQKTIFNRFYPQKDFSKIIQAIGISLFIFFTIIFLIIYNKFLFSTISKEFTVFPILFISTKDTLKLTKKALETLERIHEKKSSPSEKINSRDISRFYNKCKKNKNTLKQIRKKHKKLQVTHKRLQQEKDAIQQERDFLKKENWILKKKIFKKHILNIMMSPIRVIKSYLVLLMTPILVLIKTMEQKKK